MKILISFKNDYICFYNYNEYKIDELSKTNVLDLNEIALSDDFINKNFNFIFNFIKSNIIKKNIHKVYLDKAEINLNVFKLINNINELDYLFINEKKKIDINDFSYILNNKNIKVINCYDINEITFIRLNLSRKMKIITRKKCCNDSYLFRINNMVTYSDIYYKEFIVIDKNLTKRDFNTLEQFLKLNKYLKTIYIKFFNQNIINEILKLIKVYNKKNIKIEIFENDCNVKSILNSYSKIKKDNKKIIRKNNIDIKIKYEDKYIKKNLVKEFNLNILKNTLLSIIVVSLFLTGMSYYIKNKSNKNTLEQEKQINEIVSNNKFTVDEEVELVEKEEVKSDIKTEKPKEKSAYFKNYSKIISELKKINSDTVGWLTINNSTISYPVVKTRDNDKYLSYSFDKTKNPNGWIFMDYRNNSKDLDKNTIIYGHSGNYYVMFGSLYKVLNKNWYTNKNNQIITFNTENSNMKWQIFSIYTIKNTNDYLYTNFSNDSEYQEFLNKIKNRSIYNFNVDVTSNNNILTLSTCYKDSSMRLVIHAKKL